MTEAAIACGYKFRKLLSNIYKSSQKAEIWALVLCNTFSHSEREIIRSVEA